MAVVTISRQLGSGADDIGRAVAQTLGVPYLDKEIVRLMAQRVGISEEMAAAHDEIDHALASRLIAILLMRGPEAADELVTSAPLQPKLITSEIYQQVLRDVIQEIASSGRAVIIGRGSQVILRRQPHVLHVHICAPLQNRIERLVSQRGIDRAEAERMIQVSDRERSGYLRTEFGVDWQSPDLYDLIVNTGRLTTTAAVTTIAAAARAIEAAAPVVNSTYQRLHQDSYTVREASELLMLHPEVLRHAVYAGELPAVRAGKDTILIHRRDLINWLGQQATVAR